MLSDILCKSYSPLGEIIINGFRVVDVIASSDGTYSTIAQFQQVIMIAYNRHYLIWFADIIKPPGISCYDVYSITVTGSDIETLRFDLLIPILVDSTQTLELQDMDGLPPNRNLNIHLDASSQQRVAQSTFSKFWYILHVHVCQRSWILPHAFSETDICSSHNSMSRE